MFYIKVNCNKPTGFIVCKKESPVKFQVARGIWSARLLPWARPGIKGWDSLVALTHCVCPQCGRPGFDPWVGKIPGEGNGNPFQYSCLENPMDGGVWWSTVHGITKSRTQLSDFTFFSFTLESRETWSTQTTWASQWKRGGSPGEKVGPVKRRGFKVGLDIEIPNTDSAGVKRHLYGRKKEVEREGMIGDKSGKKGRVGREIEI